MRRRSIFLHCRAARLNPLPAATRRAGGDIDAEVLDLLASSLQGDFQFELVAAVEICGRTIEREQRRHFGGEALLELVAFSVPRLTVTLPWAGAARSRIAGKGPPVQSGSQP
jgi:hypothetical protein